MWKSKIISVFLVVSLALSGCSSNSSSDSKVVSSVSSESVSNKVEQYVYLSATGSKYHSIPDCGRMDPDRAQRVTLSEAESEGYGRCEKCFNY